MKKTEPESYTVELTPKKCKHNLEMVGRNEARCSKCGAGYQGQNVELLVQASKS